MVKLGFIGFGEAAFNIAKGLGDEGLKGIIAYDKFWNVEPQSELICERSEEANVELAPSLQAMVDKSEIIFSAVSADMAVSLAQAAKPFLKKDQIYVDINATSPMTSHHFPGGPVRGLCGDGTGSQLWTQSSGFGFRERSKDLYRKNGALRDEHYLYGRACGKRLGLEDV
jgi:hypothetical protein